MQRTEADKRERKAVFKEVLQAFEDKYSWLGHQAARELLLSAATWNIEQNNDVPMRYRTHCMLAWERGWLKSSILGRMRDVLGDDMCSTMGKVTEAGMRGSVSGGSFTPPKPLKSPIVISTEFGQTNFEDELLNSFLTLLEEGKTNITLNKLGSMPDPEKRSVEEKYDGDIKFGESNEFDMTTNFVFWGATYDPRKLQDDALRSRFNVITPAKPLSGEVTQAIDKGRFDLSRSTIKDVRKMLKSTEECQTDFTPPSHLYKEYTLTPRESRDMQSYMAARNWWGLDVNPEIMEDYIKHLKKSRRQSRMKPKELVLDNIFNNPMTYRELQEETGMEKQQIYNILQSLNAQKVPGAGRNKFAIYSEEGDEEEEEDEDEGFLDDL